MLAHADETDDFEPITKAHPGCALLPAALAMSERTKGSGQDLIRALALGYDLCCRSMGARSGHAVLRHRNCDQNVLGRLSDSGGTSGVSFLNYYRPLRSHPSTQACAPGTPGCRGGKSPSEAGCRWYSFSLYGPLGAFLSLRREHALTRTNVDRIVATLPEDGARIVDNRSMPDVNLQYLIAVALVDGIVSFDASHSYERMKTRGCST